MHNQNLGKSLWKLVGLFLTFVICLKIQPETTSKAVEMSGVSIIAYTMSNSRVTTYNSINGSVSGYIDPTDRCIITHIYPTGWLQVTYPTQKGSKTKYVKTEEFFLNADFSLDTFHIGKQMTVYKKSNLEQKIGTVYAEDKVYIIGNQDGKVQILYPLSDGSGYKLGWIEDSYIPDGYYVIRSSIDPRYVVEVYGASLDACANLQLYKYHNGDNQIFYIKRVYGNYYIIIAKHSGMVCDAEKGGTANGTNLLQYPINGDGSDNQLWELIINSNGTYSFRNKANGLYLDLDGAVAENERNIQCWGENDSSAQDFLLEMAAVSPSTLFYQAYSENHGWLGVVTDGMVAGITGHSISMKALAIELKNGNVSGIKFRVHYTDIGWGEWVSSGELAGSTDAPGSIEAVQIQLQGGLEKYYDIYYCAHCADFDWLGWAKNGEVSGTTGYAKGLEALQIKIVRKGTPFDVGGVASYTNDNGTSSNLRESVVNYMNACATILWTPKTSFAYWSDGEQNWLAGTTYYGIPYSQSNRTTNLELFQQNVINNVYVGDTGQKTYMGSDCSSAVSMAYRTVNSEFPITTTYGMFPSFSKYTRKVGNYNDDNSNNSTNICKINGMPVMFNAYRDLQPGDLLLTRMHVMMVTEVGDDYVKVTHQSKLNENLLSSWKIKEKITFNSLFLAGYIPVTMNIW